MYQFKDKAGRDIVLRPEGTSSFVRYHAQFNKDLTKKYIYFGQMFRYENPQKNRYREFTQAGAEIIGNIDKFSDFQIINDSANFLNQLNVQFTLNINTIGSIIDREKYVKELYKFFKMNYEKLSNESQEKLENNTLRILDSNVEADLNIIKNAPHIYDFLSEESIENFNDLLRLLDSKNIQYKKNERLVRGLDYYNDLTFEFISKQGVVIGGGGRYDKLSEILQIGNFNGVGVAFGVERILDLLDLNESNKKYYLIGSNIEKMIEYSKKLDLLNIPYSKPSRLSKINSQFKEAKSNNFQYVINSDEDTIKNLADNTTVEFSEKELL
jgi:histidyl-tRNA synthetase